jgi:hypothetical protein
LRGENGPPLVARRRINRRGSHTDQQPASPTIAAGRDQRSVRCADAESAAIDNGAPEHRLADISERVDGPNELLEIPHADRHNGASGRRYAERSEPAERSGRTGTAIGAKNGASGHHNAEQNDPVERSERAGAAINAKNGASEHRKNGAPGHHIRPKTVPGGTAPRISITKNKIYSSKSAAAVRIEDDARGDGLRDRLEAAGVEPELATSWARDLIGEQDDDVLAAVEHMRRQPSWRRGIVARPAAYLRALIRHKVAPARFDRERAAEHARIRAEESGDAATVRRYQTLAPEDQDAVRVIARRYVSDEASPAFGLALRVATQRFLENAAH